MITTLKKFSDGQVAARISGSGDLNLSIRGNSYEDLFYAASVKEVWDSLEENRKMHSSKLTIFCLIGQRSDKRFNRDESFDLKVIARFINQMNFDRVNIFHPHSAVSLALIENAHSLSADEFVKKAFDNVGNPVLISPDAGAYKQNYALSIMLKTDLIASNKVRINGVPHINIQGEVRGRKCLIVDDLADGGRTFVLIAKELKNLGASSVFLYVSHGQFNHGFEELKSCIDHIYCTNSCGDISNEFVTQFKVIESI